MKMLYRDSKPLFVKQTNKKEEKGGKRLRMREKFLLCIILILPLLSVLTFSVRVYGASYNVTLKAYDTYYQEYVNVNITMDGSPTNYSTPHTFLNLTGTHTFTVPVNDSHGTPFCYWFNKDTNETVTTNITMTVSSGGTYVAFYELPIGPTYYTLTISASSGGTTSPAPGTYSYQEGTIVSVTAIPNTNYAFDYWELDGAYAGTENPITITMDSDHTLKAYFTYSPPPPPPPPPPPGVGGYIIPVDKFALLAPYIGLTSIILISAVITAVYFKRVKRRKEKQC